MKDVVELCMGIGHRHGMRYKTPENYEQKFANFIKLCDDAKKDGIQRVVIAHPWVIGDNYDEVMESLSRIADAGLVLHITGR